MQTYLATLTLDQHRAKKDCGFKGIKCDSEYCLMIILVSNIMWIRNNSIQWCFKLCQPFSMILQKYNAHKRNGFAESGERLCSAHPSWLIFLNYFFLLVSLSVLVVVLATPSGYTGPPGCHIHAFCHKKV